MTKEKIMETAFKLFIEKSYSKVSIDEIARTAGVSKGAIFHYFKSKYELAKESLFFSLNEMWMKETISFDTTSPLEGARKMIDFFVDTSLKNWRLIRYVLDLYEEAVENGESMEDWSPTFSKFVLSLEKILRECGVPNPQTKAALLIVCIDALGMEYALVGGNTILNTDLVKKEIFEIFIGNYQNSSRGIEND